MSWHSVQGMRRDRLCNGVTAQPRAICYALEVALQQEITQSDRLLLSEIRVQAWPARSLGALSFFTQAKAT